MASTAAEGTTEMAIGLAHYLTVAAVLFVLGVFGIFLNLVFMVFPARQIDREFEEKPVEQLELDV